MTLVKYIGLWLVVGMAVFMVVAVVEILLLHFRGPGLRNWIHEKMRTPEKGRKPHSPHLLYHLIIGAVLLWPLVLFYYCQAAWKKRTLFEHLAHKLWERDVKTVTERLDTIILEAGEGERPITRTWEPQEVTYPDGHQGRLYYHLAAFLVDGEQKVMLSHVIGDGMSSTGDAIKVAWRVDGSEEEEALSNTQPDGAFSDLESAQKACEKDDIWLALCAPGKEEERALWQPRTPMVVGQVGKPLEE